MSRALGLLQARRAAIEIAQPAADNAPDADAPPVETSRLEMGMELPPPYESDGGGSTDDVPPPYYAALSGAPLNAAPKPQPVASYDVIEEHTSHESNTQRASSLASEYAKWSSEYHQLALKARRWSTILTGLIVATCMISVFTVGVLYYNNLQIDYMYGSVCVMVLGSISVFHNLYNFQGKSCGYVYVADICTRMHVTLKTGHSMLETGDRNGANYIRHEHNRVLMELAATKQEGTARALSIITRNSLQIEKPKARFR